MGLDMIGITFESRPLIFKNNDEREAYVEKRTKEICTHIADGIRSYLENKKMTKKELSERTGISKWRLKRILDGNYGGLSIDDMAVLSVEYSGEKDKATRSILIEKTEKQWT